MKTGDWVIHDYEIAQIKQMEGNRVTEVSDGFFQTSGHDLSECLRPLTLASKVIAESIERYRHRLNDLKGSNALNWPDIHRHFSKLSMRAIDFQTANPDFKGENPSLTEALEFVNKAKEKLADVDSVNGVRLFR